MARFDVYTNPSSSAVTTPYLLDVHFGQPMPDTHPPTAPVSLAQATPPISSPRY